MLLSFVKYPENNPATPYRVPINAFLVLVVLWSTYKLMWDCTHIDDDGDPTAMGLLEAAGLEKGPPPDSEARDREEAKDPQGIWGWITRYQRYRAKKKRRRVLGIWVVYFALGSLPIFGLGQALIDPDDVARRRTVFWLMSLYAGSALGLLMTTCFLSLRRYLRQRGVTMPAAMTSVWLTSGGVLVLVLLVLAALLPRPKAEYRLVDLTPLGQDEKKASKYSVKKGDSGKGEGQPGDQPGDTEKGQGTNGKDSPKGGDKDGKDSNGKDKDGKGGNGSKDKADEAKGGDKDKGEKNDSKAPDKKAGSDEKTKSGGERQENDDGVKEQMASMSSKLKEAVQQLTRLMKFLAFGIVGIIVVIALLNGGLRYLANFTQWARDLLEWLRNLWLSLFGSAEEKRKARKKKGVAVGVVEEPRPFAWYRNPWDDGTAGQRTLQELIRFTFAALQAWAAERGVLRELGETPLEFAARVAEEAPALAEDVDRFVGLYLRAEYAGGRLPSASTEEVRRFWERLEQATEQPMSA